ncbi:NAD-dependent epimerase/dehydratase family protein [Microbacterium terricola]|uniref:Reductase n=1 Tax=Microbacterium terricola TaxID=344163 RepID=A0ABM8DXQ7_9MICO|nr:NAD-dependent epimerase/dehydratase family protein [Microbacterium terricola]UYK39004.1 NAD-dependent epimerase/dehydratase family protein [Microbacterium terricola]BDV30290.1 reductase [Microbacterium terricola]
MTRVLILGGTGWLSGLIARHWRDRGAAVTALARGARPAPEGVELVIADRDAPDAFDAVTTRDWDEVVDISSQPRHVAAAVAGLAGRTTHWTYISSVSAYAADDEPGAGEEAALAVPLGPGEDYDYSRAKAASETIVRTALEDRAAIVRPGLVVGPGDPTDRFGYWVGRFALAGDEPVLVPDAEGRYVQVIDVDDLAPFAVLLGAERSNLTANAVGLPMPFDEFVARARRIAGHTGRVVPASDAHLQSQGVAFWAGPRSLPLWLPADATGFARRANATYLAAGGRLRDLDETLTRTLADERARGLERERDDGLSRSDEVRLLAELV